MGVLLQRLKSVLIRVNIVIPAQDCHPRAGLSSPRRRGPKYVSKKLIMSCTSHVMHEHLFVFRKPDATEDLSRIKYSTNFNPWPGSSIALPFNPSCFKVYPAPKCLVRGTSVSSVISVAKKPFFVHFFLDFFRYYVKILVLYSRSTGNTMFASRQTTAPPEGTDLAEYRTS